MLFLLFESIIQLHHFSFSVLPSKPSYILIFALLKVMTFFIKLCYMHMYIWISTCALKYNLLSPYNGCMFSGVAIWYWRVNLCALHWRRLFLLLSALRAHWVSTCRVLWPFNTVTHVVVIPNHKLLLLLSHNYNFATFVNQNANIYVFRWC